jgi:cytidine deaminase
MIPRKPNRLNDSILPDIALTDGDHELIAAANAVLEKPYRPFWHMVAAAVRSQDDRIWTGLHIGATVGRLSVCAEAVAFGRVRRSP